MNWLDRIIAVLSPQTAMHRASARQALASLEITDVYKAAEQRRMTEDWITLGNDPNAEIGPQIRRVRNRARDLGRNDPYVARAYDILAAKMVGGGIRPRLAEDVPEQTRTRTQDSWKQWVEECDPDGLQDLYGLQMIAARTMVESGEALVRFLPAPDRNMRTPWHIRILEPDWVDTDQHRALDDGGQIVQGVEFDPSGRRRAYWMFSQHPGADAFTRRFPQSVRVPANLVAPLYRQQRPDQVHGVPWSAPIVVKARHLEELNIYRLERARVQACYAVFVKQLDPGRPRNKTMPQPQMKNGKRLEEVSPGMIDYLLPDEDISFAAPAGGEGDDDWQTMVLHSIAAGLGCTYAQMTGDLRQVNYSSMRAGAIDHWALLDQWQTLILKPMHCRPLWRAFDQYESVRQRRSTLLEVEWDFPERALIDPEKDGKAIDAALLAGRRTFREVIAGRGRDPEIHIDELRRERDELADLKLPFMTPVQAPAASAAPANGADEQPPPDGEEPPNGTEAQTLQ